MKFFFPSVCSLFFTTSLIVNLSAQESVTTTPSGVVNVTVPAGNTLLAPIFVHPDDFVGIPTGVSEASGETTLTFNGSPFDAGEFDEGSFPLYYLEIVGEGALQGYNFNIVSNTTNSVTVTGLLDTDLGYTGSDAIAIRKHMTIGDIFDGATGLAPFESAITFFESDGSRPIFTWTGSGWSSDFMADDSDKPILPGTGFRFSNGSASNLSFIGSVKATPTIINLAPSFINIVTAVNPVATDLGSVGLASALEDFEDSIRTFELTGSLAGSSTFFTLAGNVYGDGFVLADDTEVEGFKGMIIQVNTGKTWTAPAAYQQ